MMKRIGRNLSFDFGDDDYVIKETKYPKLRAVWRVMKNTAVFMALWFFIRAFIISSSKDMKEIKFSETIFLIAYYVGIILMVILRNILDFKTKIETKIFICILSFCFIVGAVSYMAGTLGTHDYDFGTMMSMVMSGLPVAMMFMFGVLIGWIGTEILKINRE